MKVNIARPYWSDLRGIGNSAPAKAVILIPLIGYWIIFNESLLQYAALSPALHADGSQTEPGSISMRLFATYFGLTFIALGSLVYQLRCPSEVQLYPTASAYVGGIFPSVSGIEMTRVENALAEGDDESRKARQRIEDSFHGWGKGIDREAVNAMRDNASKNTLQSHFDLCNRSYPVARAAAGLCYAVGIVLLTIPAAHIFWRVTLALWRSIF